MSNVLDETLQQDAVELEKKAKHKRLFNRGFNFLCFGGAMLIISFGINFVFFHTDTSFAAFMYTLTIAGSICMMKGLADIMGF